MIFTPCKDGLSHNEAESIEPEEATAGAQVLFEARDPDGSWAACDYEPGTPDFVVTQFGPRRLWDEMEAAYLSWVDTGMPGPERYGMTIEPEAERIWLDDPRNVLGNIRVTA